MYLWKLPVGMDQSIIVCLRYSLFAVVRISDFFVGLISVAISPKPLGLTPILLRGVMKYLIGFPVTLKCLTLNDLEMPFYAIICFIVGFTKFLCLAFGDNCVKTAATRTFASESSFWRYKKCANIFVRNFAYLFRRQVCEIVLPCAVFTWRTPNWQTQTSGTKFSTVQTVLKARFIDVSCFFSDVYRFLFPRSILLLSLTIALTSL